MLRLSLFRHAKSSWDDLWLADHDRPLSKRGRRDAPRMAAFMRAQSYVPDLIVCSRATRARQTLDLAFAPLTEGLNEKPRIEFENAIYEVSPEKLLAIVVTVGCDVRHLMVVGHNPALEALAQLLVVSGGEQLRANMCEKFPTAALAVIDFKCERWTEIKQYGGLLSEFMVPRRLD